MEKEVMEISLKEMRKVLSVPMDDSLADDFFISDVRYNKGLEAIKYPCRFNGYVGILCIRGGLKAEINLRTFDIKENSLLINVPGNIGRITDTDDDGSLFKSEFIIVVMSREFVSNVSYDFVKLFNESLTVLDNPCIQLNIKEKDMLCSYLDLADKVTRSGMSNTREAIQGLVSSMFFLMGNLWLEKINNARMMLPRRSTARSKMVLEQFLKLVLEFHNEEREVGFYADRLCLTPKYLSKMIRETSGKSAPEWIDSFVILEAKNLLKHSGKPIKEISAKLGFSSITAFHTFFKKKVGLTPSGYRNNG